MLFLLEHYDEPEPVNVGAGTDVSLVELANLVREIVGFQGRIVWDSSKPEGVPRRLLDSRRLNELGWRPAIALEEGVRRTYAWYLKQVGAAA